MIGSVKLLAEENFRELNIDIQKLNIDSHQKIIVQCLQCREKFTREFRHIGQKHHCATHIIREDGTKLKWCNGCKLYLTYTCFTKNAARYDGLGSICNACLSGSAGWEKIHDNTKKKPFTLNGWLKWIVIQRRSDCKKVGIPFDIDSDYLLKQYEAQNGLCYYSKIKLEFGTKNLRSASLERLDQNKGYIRGNVALASKAMNLVKNYANTAEFIEYLLELANGLAQYIRLETKIIDKNAKLPFRKRTTDAGYDIASTETVIIPPHTTINISTGIIICPPDGFYFTIEGRSSMAMKGIIPFRGTIDATYQGHLMVALTNTSNIEYSVKAGDRIAQIVLHPIINADFCLVDEFSPINNGRAECGFGSTGQ